MQFDIEQLHCLPVDFRILFDQLAMYIDLPSVHFTQIVLRPRGVWTCVCKRRGDGDGNKGEHLGITPVGTGWPFHQNPVKKPSMKNRAVHSSFRTGLLRMAVGAAD
jgi:hypothetical protein